jgi:hypothetical protein
MNTYVDYTMLGGFCKVNYRIHIWVLELCKPLIPLQIELLILDASIWTNSTKNIQKSHLWIVEGESMWVLLLLIWCYSVIENLKFYMSSIQPTIAISFSCVNPPGGPCFLDLVLLMKWSNKDVRGIFQVCLAFHNDVKPFSTTSIAFFKAFVVHLSLIILFVFVYL